MTVPSFENPHDQLERWLDGELTGDSLAEAQRAAEADPARRAERAIQDRIDAALGRMFSVPEFPLIRAEENVAAHALAEVASPSKRKTPLRTYALAASLLVACSLLWWHRIDAMYQQWQASRYVTGDLGDVYVAAVGRGFQPDWRCEDDKLFAATFQERQKQPLWLGPLPVGSTMLGLAYLEDFTPLGTAMLAQVDGKPVLVLVDRTDRVPSSTTETTQPGLHVHRVLLGPLTLLEVSPLAAPRVAPHLELRAAVPDEETGRVPGEGPSAEKKNLRTPQ